MQNTQEEQVELTEEEIYNKAFYGDEYEASQADDIPQEEEQAEEPSAGDDVEPTEDEVINQEPEAETDEPAPTFKTIKINGKEVQATEEELIALAQKGFDYTRKTQELAEKRRELERYQGIEAQEIEMLKRAKSGDKTALAALTKQYGIDPVELLDVNADDFRPMQQEEIVVPSREVQQIFESIRDDQQLIGKLRDAESHLPRKVMETAVQDPMMMRAVINEINSGDYEIVQPHLDKQMAMLNDVDRTIVMSNPQAYAQFYINVKQSLIDQYQQANNTEQIKSSKPKPNLAEVGIQKSGASKSDRVTPKESDAWSDDEAYQRVLNRMRGY